MYCKGDPRVPEFYQRRQALAKVTTKLKSRGEEKKGLDSKAVLAIDKRLAKIFVKSESGRKENEGGASELVGKGKKRGSADRDLVACGAILSPKKCQRLH